MLAGICWLQAFSKWCKFGYEARCSQCSFLCSNCKRLRAPPRQPRRPTNRKGGFWEGLNKGGPGRGGGGGPSQNLG